MGADLRPLPFRERQNWSAVESIGAVVSRTGIEKVFSPRSICPWDSNRKLLLVLEIHCAVRMFVLTEIAVILMPCDPRFQSLLLFLYYVLSGLLQVFFKVDFWVSFFLLFLLCFLLLHPTTLLSTRSYSFWFGTLMGFFSMCLFPVPPGKQNKTEQPNQTKLTNWSWGLSCGYVRSYGGKPVTKKAWKNTRVSEICHSSCPSSVLVSHLVLLQSSHLKM